MQATTTSKTPFSKIFLDIVGPMLVSRNGNKYILTIQDDLTKYSMATPIPSQDTNTVAKAFSEHFICNFGAPTAILTDQGCNFMSDMFVQLCKILKIKKFNTTVYHPESNGALERSHRTLTEYLRSFSHEDQLAWDEWIPYAIFTYNSTPHTSTGYMPIELLLGYKPNIPSSIQQDNTQIYTYDDYLSELKVKLQYSWKVANQKLIDHKIKSKEYYDQNSNTPTFYVGDKVLLKNEAKTSKLESLWTGPYEVVDTKSYNNSKIRINRKVKTVHNNRLKHFHE